MRSSKLLFATCFGLHPIASRSAYAESQAGSICPILPIGIWQSPTCPIDAPDSVGNDPVSAQGDDWFRSDTCHEVGPDEICAFTQPSFNAGHGIAVVTTAQILEKMVSLPIFTIPGSQKPAHQESTILAYRDEQIPGKGIGLVASRPIQTNEAFLSRMPIVMVDDTAFKRLGRARLTELLNEAIGDLPETHQAEYLNLTTHGEVNTHHEKVYEIFMKNDFLTPVDDIMDFHSVFPQVSRLNHACRPNSKYTFDASTLSQSVFAARKVETGEELTVAYFDSIQTHSQRQLLSKHGWGFECTCSYCSSGEEIIEESDRRIEQIHMLQKDLDDYSPESAATPDKAELLVRLFEEEGLITRMVEAYYRAAVEWSGVGNAAEAIKFAKVCIKEGEVLESSIRPFINNMRELVKYPSAHWTWQFRLSHK